MITISEYKRRNVRYTKQSFLDDLAEFNRKLFAMKSKFAIHAFPVGRGRYRLELWDFSVPENFLLRQSGNYADCRIDCMDFIVSQLPESRE